MMMKAAMTLRYGPASVLETRDVPTPTVSENQVLIEVHATPITAGDLRLRSADFPSVTAILGRLMFGVLRPRVAVQGTMFAGRVVQIGRAVTRYAVGDDVFGSAMNGAYAEYLVMPEGGPMAKMPSNVRYDEAAAVPYGGVTALRFLRDIGSVQCGDKVLIVGAAGGVGSYAVQIAKQLGGEVTGLCSRRSLELVRGLGADHVLSYETTNALEQPEQYDVVFDTAGVTSFAGAKSALRPGGRYMNLVISIGMLWQLFLTSLFRKKRVKFGVALGDHRDVDLLRELMERGVLRPVVGLRFPFADMTAAHLAAENSRHPGVVVVTRGTSQI